MAHTAGFWDRIAKRYAKQPVADEVSYEKKLEITRGYLRPDMEVLELGCGTGSTAILHAPHVRHIRAVDISPRMLEIARHKTEVAGIDNITYECAAIDDLCLEPESVDMVLALNILHLVDDREPVIRMVHEALKPGGTLVASTACLADWLNWLTHLIHHPVVTRRRQAL